MRSIFQYIQLAAATASGSMSAAASYVLLKVDAIVGYFVTFLELSDTARASDSAVKTVGKGLTETTQAGEILVKSYGKPLSDTGSASDLAAKTAGKTASDSAQASDTSTRTLNKALADTTYATDDVNGVAADDDQVIQVVKVLSEIVVPNETFVRAVGYSREFLDSAVNADVAAKTFIKNLTDTVNVSDDAQVGSEKIESPTDGSSVTDQTVIAVEKTLTETPTAADTAFRDFIKGLAETPTATDSAVIAAGKALIDSTSASDAGTVISQGYCDITYFAEDYVGTSRTF
jgi:hypothetical protein